MNRLEKMKMSQIKIEVLEGDLTQMAVDAIVNPANSFGKMGGGVAGAIKRAGGREIEQEAVAKAPIPVGEAVATTAGRLPARYVLHAPTMEKPTQRTTVEKVKMAVEAALRTADALRLKTLAFPGMGTGVGKVPPEKAAEAIVSTIRAFAPKTVQKIFLVDKNKKMAQCFREAVKSNEIE